MTNSPTPAERLALKTAHAALESRDASYDLVSTVVFALGAAGLLMDPEKAKRFAELEAAAGDGSTRTVDEDPIAFALTEQAEALHASSGAVIEVPGPCRNTSPYGRRCDYPKGHDGDHGMADGAGGHFGWPAEDPHDSKLRHTYAIGRELPEVPR